MHGPLNLISILDLWRDLRGGGDSENLDVVLPEKISYRATSPLYAEDEYRIVLTEGADKKSAVEIITPAGNVGMKAEITGV